VLDYAAAHNKGVILKKVLSSGHSEDPASALAFSLGAPGVTSAIVGTITPENLRANAHAAQRAR
jgi:aryl-alcohol dehydrogenase-like predicted oxidoreductase